MRKNGEAIGNNVLLGGLLCDNRLEEALVVKIFPHDLFVSLVIACRYLTLFPISQDSSLHSLNLD